MIESDKLASSANARGRAKSRESPKGMTPRLLPAPVRDSHEATRHLEDMSNATRKIGSSTSVISKLNRTAFEVRGSEAFAAVASSLQEEFELIQGPGSRTIFPTLRHKATGLLFAFIPKTGHDHCDNQGPYNRTWENRGISITKACGTCTGT